MEENITKEEQDKIISLIDFYCAPLTSCSGVGDDFSKGYNYALSKLKDKIRSINV